MDLALNLADNQPKSLLLAATAGRATATRTAYSCALRTLPAYLAATAGLPTATVDQAVEALLAAGPGRAYLLASAWLAQQRQEGAAPLSIRLRASALGSVVSYARRIGLITWELDLSRDVPRAESRSDRRGPDRAGIERLFEEAGKGKRETAARNLCLLWLLYGAGLRVGEAVGLAVEDYDAKRQEIRIIGKGHWEKQAMPISKAVATAIEYWLTIRGTAPGPLLQRLDRAGRGGLTVRGAGLIVSQIGAGSGLGVVRCHGLRHSAITRVLDTTNGNIRVAAQFARHASINTTAKYDDSRRSGEVVRNAAEEISR